MRQPIGLLDIGKFLALAMALSALPIGLVAAKVLPEGAIQLGALSPSIAAFIFAFAHSGARGIGQLGKCILQWRAPVHVWVFTLLFLIVPAIISAFLTGLITGNAFTFDTLPPLFSVIPMILILTVFAGLGEEFGWRGYLLPSLMDRHSALTASLIVGLAWGIWHIPLFFTPGAVQQEWAQQAGLFAAIAGYIIFCVVWSIQYTWIFIRSNGSVLLAAVFHGAGNAWIGGYIDVYRGDVTGVFVFTGVMMVFSLFLAILFGKQLAQKD